MESAATNGDQVYLQPGDVIRLHLPHSEVCMSMRVAGKSMRVQLLQDGDSSAAQLISDSGLRFSSPILPGEAGIFTDSDGRFYVPARAIAPPLQLRLFVPKPDSWFAATVAPGSAIVGMDSSDQAQAQIRVDYEGNVHGATNLTRYWQRAQHAADRHLANHPTVARSVVPRAGLVPVGWYNVDRQEVTFDGSEQTSWLVGAWLGLTTTGQQIESAELKTSQPSGDQQIGGIG